MFSRPHKLRYTTEYELCAFALRYLMLPKWHLSASALTARRGPGQTSVRVSSLLVAIGHFARSCTASAWAPRIAQDILCGEIRP